MWSSISKEFDRCAEGKLGFGVAGEPKVQKVIRVMNSKYDINYNKKKKSYLKEEIKKCMNARITKFNVSLLVSVVFLAARIF